MSDIQFSGTWGDLLRGLQTLTPEQLACNIEATTENSLYPNVSLQITTERHYWSEGEYQGAESDLLGVSAEDLAEMDVQEAGHIYLSLD